MADDRKILLIDDDEETLQALVTYFTKRGYAVSSASNGLDGLKILEQDSQSYVAVITDIVMPTVSGVGVISIIRKKYPHLSAIAITGWGEHPEALASEAKADRIIKKPFELIELEKEIVKLVTQKKTQNG